MSAAWRMDVSPRTSLGKVATARGAIVRRDKVATSRGAIVRKGKVATAWGAIVLRGKVATARGTIVRNPCCAETAMLGKDMESD